MHNFFHIFLARICTFFFLAMCVFVIAAPCSYSASVTLEWTASESTVDGYMVYYGTASGDYQFSEDAGDQTTYTVGGLQQGTRYYFAATAYTNDSLESDFSNEENFLIPGPVTDADSDGVSDELDNCPGQYNPNQSDLDNDGLGDVCDNDMDEDGIPNNTDNCPSIANPEQTDSDNNGNGDACDGDLDGDGIANESDNCPSLYNPGQDDIDEDSIGDLCDDDLDGDDVVNINDNCPAGYNPGQEDTDADDIGDACEDDDTFTLSIEAEEMSYHANGKESGDYWLLWSNGTMQENITVPQSNSYRVEVTAKGSLALDVGPEMELIINNEVVDTVFVDTTTPETFVFDAEIPAGNHALALGFNNDYYDSSEGHDRNLYVDRTVISFMSAVSVNPSDENSSATDNSGSTSGGSSSGGGGGSSSTETTNDENEVTDETEAGTSGDTSSGGGSDSSAGSECISNADCSDGLFCSSEGVCVECLQDNQCDDGLSCNGIEICYSNQCIAGDSPCNEDEICDEENATCFPAQCTADADCDDGLFCNGEETCVNGTCSSEEPPCGNDQICNEEEQECLDALFVEATCLQDTVYIPRYRKNLNQLLILRIDEPVEMNISKALISIAGPDGDNSGVEIDIKKDPLKINSHIFISVKISKDAQTGQYTITIKEPEAKVVLTSYFSIQ